MDRAGNSKKEDSTNEVNQGGYNHQSNKSTTLIEHKQHTSDIHTQSGLDVYIFRYLY